MANPQEERGDALAHVYCLMDDEGAVRYVGVSHDPEARVRAHWNARKQKPTEFAEWLEARGIPAYRVVEDVPFAQRFEAEHRWITHYREQGAQLFNMSDGYAPHTEGDPKRVTVGLDAAEAAILERIKEGDSIEATALGSLINITLTTKASVSQSVHAILVAGIQAIEAEALEIGYRKQAEYEASHPDCQAWRRAMRGRGRRPFMDNHAEESST